MSIAQSISQKLLKGAAWNSVAQFGSQAVNFLVILILARLLEPADFGLVGMVTVFTIFLGYFSECGLTPSLIQQKNVDETDYSTVFWSTVVFSAAIYIIVFFGAPFISMFYHEERLTPLVRVLFISFLFAPFSFAPVTKEKKELRYHNIAAAEILSLVISGAVAIILAFMKFGVWSLVWLEITRVLFRSFFLMIFTRWFPRFIFSMDRLRRLMNSGIHFTFSNLIAYAANNIDFLLVGKLLGPSALGVYSLAFRVSRYPFTKIWGIFGQMLFPAFVGFREDSVKVRRSFFKISVLGGIALTPLIVGIFIGMRPATILLFGEKWIDMVPIVRILLIFILVDSISIADNALMMAFNRIRTVNRVKIWVSIALLIAGYPAARWYGANGMAWVFSAVSVVDALVVKHLVLKEIGIRWSDCLRPLTRVLEVLIFSSLFLGAYFFMFEDQWAPLAFLTGQVILTTVFMAIYLLKRGVLRFQRNFLDLGKVF